MLLFAPLVGCGESGATLTNREKFICSQCHAPPIADQHSAAEWPAVIARMVGYMQANNKMVPNAREQDEILKFYQTRAGR
jgi:anaerobic ribonucleoside-triphosphate reductase